MALLSTSAWLQNQVKCSLYGNSLHSTTCHTPKMTNAVSQGQQEFENVKESFGSHVEFCMNGFWTASSVSCLMVTGLVIRSHCLNNTMTILTALSYMLQNCIRSSIICTNWVPYKPCVACFPQKLHCLMHKEHGKHNSYLVLPIAFKLGTQPCWTFKSKT